MTVKVFFDFPFMISSPEKMLYNTVFQRLVANGHYPPIYCKQLKGLLKHITQHLQLAVYFNPSSLEDSGNAFDLVLTFNYFFYCIAKLCCCFYRAQVNNLVGNLAAQPLFAQMIDNIPKLFVGVFIDDLIGSNTLQITHPHIQRSFFLEGESSFCRCYLVGRDAEI